MGSAAIAKGRLTRLSWPEWCHRVDQLLSVGKLSRADLPGVPFRSLHMQGMRPASVAIPLLRRKVGWGEKKAVVGNE